MNPLDTFKGGVDGIAEKVTGEDAKLFQEFTKLVQNTPEGISGFLKQFKDKGLDDVVDVVTGKAPNKAITPEQMVKGFGIEKINALATAAGVDPKIVPEKLAYLFPKVVEKLNYKPQFAGTK